MSPKKHELVYLRFATRRAEFEAKIWECLASISEFSRSKQLFYKAARYALKIYESSDLFEKQIKMYMTQEILPIFEDGAKISYSLEEVERKRDKVFKWLSEVKSSAKKLQKKITACKEHSEEIAREEKRLQKKISDNYALTDFVNTIRFLVSEFEGARKRTTDQLTSFFDSLKFHRIVEESSRDLFRDGHYSPAIFEAYKTLCNHVKRKSKLRDLKCVDLMTKAFGFTYDQRTRQITRKPILQLNELATQSDRDEQVGFMHLFMGSMFGIRNPKAHDRIVQKDPFRTLEYLSFVSLLAKRVDEAKLNC